MNISKLVPLDTLKTGESGIVCTLPEEPFLRIRLSSLGLIPGTKITMINVSPFGDPKAYFFRGAFIALRHKDAVNILIRTDKVKNI
ncbi:MAG: ferrous iron transport protein A [Clostridia bacterium]|nr:ferrous iron transport protein A [Clostridia bacterium]